jgi:tetratricopeptide (TPR) repeat protein
LQSVLARAIELSPKRAQAHYIFANIALKKGDRAAQSAETNRYYREALSSLEAYAATVPALDEPRFIIASLYLVLKDERTSKQWADEGLVLYRGQPDVARKALRYYIAIEDWHNARRFLLDILAEEPADYPVLYDLAKIEFLTGNRPRALEIVQELRIKVPGLVEQDPVFLQSLGG